MNKLIAEKDDRTADAFFARHTELEICFLIQQFPEYRDPEILQSTTAYGCYLHYRESGMDHQLAAMQACRRAPQMKGSDRSFNEHARNRMNTMSPLVMAKVLKAAHRAGVQTQGKFYVGPLADRRGAADPRAWVSTTEEVRGVVRERNYESTGIVEHRAEESPPPKKVPLAPELVTEFLQSRAQKDPEFRAKLKEGGQKAVLDAREAIVDKHGRSR